MNLTLSLLIASIALIGLFTALLTRKKIRNLIYFALVALVVLFDFAILSLDKIYFLHKEQDEAFLIKLKSRELAMEQQLGLYRDLTDIQLEFTLQAITQNITSNSEAQVRQKVALRDKLVSQLENLAFDEATVQMVKQHINLAVHQYLMEKLNKSVIDHIGHRTYGEFVRRRPRHEWTDELFIKELEPFLEKDALLNDEIKQRLQVLKVFDQSGLLL